jgi:hypothetical protein
MSNCCDKFIVLHKGASGQGIPTGGTVGQIYVKASNDDFDGGWVDPPSGTNSISAPALSANNNLIAFDGITGKLAKDSGISVTDVFTTTLALNKVDKIAGMGLSQNNFTTALLNKLNAATEDNFRGQYLTFVALTTAVPAGVSGDYAYVAPVAGTLQLYVWDDTNSAWSSINASLGLDGRDIADLIFNTTSAATYSRTTSENFTTNDKDALAAAATLDYVNQLALNAGIIAPSYGGVSYFNLTGTPIAFTTISDGASNLVPVVVPSTAFTGNVGFDNGGGTTGRIRYTGTEQRLFTVEATFTYDGTTTVSIFSAIAKNGSVVVESRALSFTDGQVTLNCLVSLATNDYVELYAGNLTDITPITVKALSIKISAA